MHALIVQERIGMDCLTLLGERDLQQLGLAVEHVKLFMHAASSNAMGKDCKAAAQECSAQDSHRSEGAPHPHHRDHLSYTTELEMLQKMYDTQHSGFIWGDEVGPFKDLRVFS